MNTGPRLMSSHREFVVIPDTSYATTKLYIQNKLETGVFVHVLCPYVLSSDGGSWILRNVLL